MTKKEISEAVEKIVENHKVVLRGECTDHYCYPCLKDAIFAGIELGKIEMLDELEKVHSNVCIIQGIILEYPEDTIKASEECYECNWIIEQRAKLKENQA